MKPKKTKLFNAKPAILALAGCSAFVASTSSTQAQVIFDDDFQDTTAWGNATDATKQTELNAGVATGSWTVTDGVNSTDIQSDGTNKGLFIDRGPFDITANFSQLGDINGTTISFDFHTTRDSPSQPKTYSFIGYEGGTQLFNISVDNPNNDSKVLYTDTSGANNITGIVEEQIGGFSTAQLRTITITLSGSTYDVWLDDTTTGTEGVVDSGELLSNLSYSNAPTSGITDLQFLGSGTEGSSSDAAGVAVDNLLVNVPEPSAAVLISLSLLALFRRRR